MHSIQRQAISTASIFKTNLRPKSYRYNIFKGVTDQNGKVQVLRQVGAAYLDPDTDIYSILVKTLLSSVFYMRHARNGPADFEILTREFSRLPGQRYQWNHVGVGKILYGKNAGVAQLTWDFFGFSDIYMQLYPSEKENGVALRIITSEAA